ncbi:MAG: EF-hand domain-containing protein [Planctomycetaceae bacterium]
MAMEKSARRSPRTHETRLDRLDTNKDGFIDLTEMRQIMERVRDLAPADQDAPPIQKRKSITTCPAACPPEEGPCGSSTRPRPRGSGFYLSCQETSSNPEPSE